MLAEVQAGSGERALEHLVDHVGAEGYVEQGERLEVVPSGWSYPVVLGFGGVHPDECCWVGGSQRPDGASVGEEGVVNGARD